MVCLGNICRSPIAEGVLKKYLPKDFFFIDSAGTSSYHVGCKPDHRSIEVAKRYGIFIENQKCRQFNVNDFNPSSYGNPNAIAIPASYGRLR